MALYLLEYDLRKQRDYQKLYDELAKFGAVRILESLWCFKKISTSPVILRDHFANFIDTDDGLMVAEISDWATIRTRGTPKDLS